MNKTFSKIITLLLGIILLSGCAKQYKKLSYIDYNEYFNKKEGYIIIDHSSNNGLEVIRELEAGNGDIQVIYLEFNNEELANRYIEDNYTKEENYKIKNKNDYTFIKNTKNRYFKLYKASNVIVYAVSSDKKDKKEINNILKDLGY